MSFDNLKMKNKCKVLSMKLFIIMYEYEIQSAVLFLPFTMQEDNKCQKDFFVSHSTRITHCACNFVKLKHYMLLLEIQCTYILNRKCCTS